MFCLLHNQIAFGEITAVLTPISQPEANRSMEIYKEKAFLVFANFLNHQRFGGSYRLHLQDNEQTRDGGRKNNIQL